MVDPVQWEICEIDSGGERRWSVSGKIEIKKFNGQSFEFWKLKKEDLSVDKDQWIAVDLGTKPTRVTDEEWKKLDWKAKTCSVGDLRD